MQHMEQIQHSWKISCKSANPKNTRSIIVKKDIKRTESHASDALAPEYIPQLLNQLFTVKKYIPIPKNNILKIFKRDNGRRFVFNVVLQIVAGISVP